MEAARQKLSTKNVLKVSLKKVDKNADLSVSNDSASDQLMMRAEDVRISVDMCNYSEGCNDENSESVGDSTRLNSQASVSRHNSYMNTERSVGSIFE